MRNGIFFMVKGKDGKPRVTATPDKHWKKVLESYRKPKLNLSTKTTTVSIHRQGLLRKWLGW